MLESLNRLVDNETKECSRGLQKSFVTSALAILSEQPKHTFSIFNSTTVQQRCLRCWVACSRAEKGRIELEKLTVMEGKEGDGDGDGNEWGLRTGKWVTDEGTMTR